MEAQNKSSSAIYPDTKYTKFQSLTIELCRSGSDKKIYQTKHIFLITNSETGLVKSITVLINIVLHEIYTCNVSLFHNGLLLHL